MHPPLQVGGPQPISWKSEQNNKATLLQTGGSSACLTAGAAYQSSALRLGLKHQFFSVLETVIFQTGTAPFALLVLRLQHQTGTTALALLAVQLADHRFGGFLVSKWSELIICNIYLYHILSYITRKQQYNPYIFTIM